MVDRQLYMCGVPIRIRGDAGRVRRRRMRRRLVVACRPVAGVCVAPDACGHPCAPVDIEDLWLYVRRRGNPDGKWLVKYPAFELAEDGAVCFRFDDLFPTDPGRYEGEIRRGDSEVLGHVEIDVRTSGFSRGAARGQYYREDWKPPYTPVETSPDEGPDEGEEP